MVLVVPNAAEAAQVSRILDPDMVLKLFTNDVINGLTSDQIEALDETDFTEATFDGYAPVPIAGENQGGSSDWTISSGAPCVAVGQAGSFACDQDQLTPQTVYGYYVVRDSDGGLEWFEYIVPAQIFEFNGDETRVTPRYTLKDETD